ncbi:MAG: AbrB/MazE/SpoVT family DNA-binding domain-containing protein [Legionellales bacterium]|nr:AbrB/MazE/SpoVT family DNA-binding domain-containing protein [Legionellales bacterium]
MSRRLLATTKMSSRGQIVVPEEFREKMRLEPGTQFMVLSEGDALIFKIIAPPPKEDLTALLANVRKQTKEVGIKKEEINDVIESARKLTKKKNKHD